MKEAATLAHYVDYRQLATRHDTVDGDLCLSQLPRISAELANDADTNTVISARLQFEEDSQRRVHVAGRVKTTLRLVCQRCLKAFDKPMVVVVAGVVVSDDKAAADVPRADEPILADGDTLDLYALIGDELLLALPSVARCECAECVAHYERAEPEPEQAAQDERRDKPRGKSNNPFAALDSLKRDLDSNGH